MLSAEQKKIGYICIPYKHDKFTVNVKEILTSSRNIKSIYFGTATFSDESKSYFPSSTNHYMLAKFENHQKLIKDVKKFTNSSPSFVFSVDDELFERDVNIEQKFISMYSKNTPLKRMMKKNELNHLIKFLCTENSSYATGSTFVIDGGYTSW